MKTTRILFGVILALPTLVSGTDARWQDAEARIQYGYYTEDARALANLTSSLGQEGSDDVMRGYYAALAYYRLAQLHSERDREQARESLERCIDALDRVLDAEDTFAEALALQAACLGKLALLSPWRAPFAGSRSSAQIEKALRLAPGNPRVLLLDAIIEYERSAGTGNGLERVSVRLRKAVDAFERERQGVEPVPGWGAAEAYTFLARSHLDRGDALAARDALERALLIAPEFALARRLMIRITSG